MDFTAVELDEVGKLPRSPAWCTSVSANLSVIPWLHTRIAVEGEEVMDALLAITHRRTVPQVFIKGEFIGGCDGELCLQPAYAVYL